MKLCEMCEIEKDPKTFSTNPNHPDICEPCNEFLAAFDYNPDTLERLAAYVEWKHEPRIIWEAM